MQDHHRNLSRSRSACRTVCGHCSRAPPQVVVHNVLPREPDPTELVALNECARQGTEVKVPRMADDDYQAALKVYKAAEGDFPARGECPTIDQCSAFLAIMRKYRSIMVDFAIFVPNGDRAKMRRHFTHRVLDANGCFTFVEVYAPPTSTNGCCAGVCSLCFASCSGLCLRGGTAAMPTRLPPT